MVFEQIFVHVVPRAIKNVRKTVKFMSVSAVLLLAYWLFHSLI